MNRLYVGVNHHGVSVCNSLSGEVEDVIGSAFGPVLSMTFRMVLRECFNAVIDNWIEGLTFLSLQYQR
jgi:hypothetical protein